MYRTSDPTNPQDIGRRLREARLAREIHSAAACARRFGWNPTTYQQAENGTRPPSRTAALEYARKLGVSAAWLLEGHGVRDEAPAAPAFVGVPLLSWVSAGGLTAVDGVTGFEDTETLAMADLDQDGDWIALRVEGDSMDRISPPGSVIFVNRRDTRLVPNACYVIADEDGAATYKRYRPNPDRWEPVSTNPEHEAKFPAAGAEPVIIGRVRKSVIAM